MSDERVDRRAKRTEHHNVMRAIINAVSVAILAVGFGLVIASFLA